jgi:hypothetical protein
VDLAGINVQKDIARAHSEVVGEALKHAKIDIVGGENDFFEKVVRAVGNGKSVERLVNNSSTLTDIRKTFFNGDSDYFRGQLRQWIDQFGVNTEDVKNLTLSALLAKLMASTGDTKVQSMMSSALNLARNQGLAEVPASQVISAPSEAHP